MENKSFIKFYEFFGMHFNAKAGENEFISDCPFSGKKNKFYANALTGLWDSKSAGMSGNIYGFMEQYYKICLADTGAGDLQKLSDNRKLPVSAFIGRVAKNLFDDRILIPTYNFEKKLICLSLCHVGKAIFRAPLVKTHMIGAEDLAENLLTPVYICEGEWDFFALRFVLDSLELEGVVLGVPGANTFKEEWIANFIGRDVICAYDNDDAGRKGERKISLLLGTKPFKMRFVAWAEELPEEYDLRDFVVGHFVDPLHPTEDELLSCFADLQTILSDKNYYQRNGEDETGSASGVEIILEPIAHTDLEKVYGSWLKMLSYDPLAIIFGTCFANKIQGDPVWTFLIAPPGGMKTELIMTLNKSDYIETVTTLTPASMVCGLRSPDGSDHSILIKVNKRMMVIKDFTTILSGNPMIRDEVFGFLRDIYDGYVEKYFAFGKKSYKSHFGIIAGVTPMIDSMSGSFTALGERFIKYRLDSILPELGEQERIKRAIDNINSESTMREEMQIVAQRMLAKKIPEVLPTFDQNIISAITDLSMFTSKMQGAVPKDKFSGEQTTKPITAIATRLSKQLMKLAIGIAIYFDHTEIGPDEMRLIKIVARDTCPDRIEDLIKNLFLKGENAEVDLPWFCQITRFSSPTILRLTQDLCSLGLINRVQGMERVKSLFVLDKKFRALIVRTRIYERDILPEENPIQKVFSGKISIKLKK